MADWSKPTITSNYVTFVDEVKARDVDAITLQYNAVVNPPVASVKMARLTHPIMKFQEWNGSAFVDRILAPEGGGTGVTSIAGLVPALGLGTMAYQNSNNINVTGGYMNGIRIDNPTVYGTFSQNSGVYSLQGNMAINNTVNAAVALNVVTSLYSYWATVIQNTSAFSLGLLVRAGTSKGDQCLNLENAAATINFILVRGDGAMIFNAGTLAIPVGANKYVVT